MHTVESPTSSASLSQLLEYTRDGLAYFEARRNKAHQITDFVLKLANQAARSWLTPSDQPTEGCSIKALYPWVEPTGLFQELISVCETGVPAERQQRYPAQDRWVKLTARQLGDGVAISFEDITNNRQQTETLQGILDTIPTGIFVSEAVRDKPVRDKQTTLKAGEAPGPIIDFRIVEVNPVALRITGRNRRDIEGRLASEVFPEDRENGVFAQFVMVLETGQPKRYELNWHPNGESYWLDIQMVPLGTDRVIVVHADITALKQAQEEQRQQAQFLEKIVSTSQNGIVVYEAVRDAVGQAVDFRCTFFNPAAQSILELTADIFQGKTLLEQFPPAQFPDVLPFFVSLLDNGQPFRNERHIPTLDKWLDISGAPFGDGFLLTFSDISANRLNLQRIEQANLDLRLSNNNLQQFAYVASHDLQEPLRKIQQFGDLLKTDYAPVLGDAGADLIRRMQSASIRMSGLIKDLLVYSRVSTQRQPFQRVSLSSLLEEVLDDLEVTIRETQAVIEWEELPPVLGDKAQLRQLLQNLLSNALKFHQPGAVPQVRLFCRTVKAAAIPVAASPLDREGAVQATYYYQISLSDNGIGFDEKYLDRIFQVFQRLHGKTNYPGTGVGLAICRKVVENHAGYITATSQPGQGATFSIYLPA